MFPAGQDIAVTLCCAQADAAIIQPIVDRLESEGIWTTLLSGVANDPFLLGQAIDEESGACVFVVCQSPTLGQAEYRRLVGIHSARRGPRHAIIGLSLDPEAPLAMIDGINSAIARAQRLEPRPTGGDDASESSIHRLRDVVGVTTIDAVGTDALPPPTQRVSVPNRAERERAKEAPEAAGAAENGKSDPHQRARRKAAAVTSSTAHPALPPEATSNRGSWFIAGFAALAFLLLAGFALFGGGLGQGNTSRPDDPAPQPGSSGPSDPAPQPVAAASPPHRRDPLTKTNDSPPVATNDDAGDAPLPSTGSTGDDTDDTDDTDGSEEGEPGDDTEAVDEDTLLVANPDSEILTAAIAKGELRALDLLVIAPSEGAMTWREAANTCRKKKFEGIRGWRLPKLAELKAMRGSRMLGMERYWSTTLARKEGDGHDHVYVFSVAQYGPESVAKIDTDVHAFCVRER